MGKTVLFGVDPQNDFGDPKGSLYCKGGYEIVGGGILLMKYAVHQSWLVGLSADWHPKDSGHFKPIGLWPPHCVEETWGARFLPGIYDFLYFSWSPFFDLLKVNVFLKGTNNDGNGYDPFEGKNALNQGPEEVMGEPNQTTIIAWGIATNFCVRAFVLTALRKGYRVSVVLDACRAVPTPDNPPPDFVTEEQAIEEMKAADGIMTTVEEVINGRIV